MWTHYLSAEGTLYTWLEPDWKPGISPSSRAPRALEASTICSALYLDSLLLRKDSQRAQRVFRGLLKSARISGIPGFVVRGIYPDGKRFYDDPSVMDYAALHYGLWRYFSSSQATSLDKEEIKSIVEADLNRLEEDRFIILNSMGDPTSFSELAYPGPGEGEHLLAMLLTGYRITGNAHWLDVYHRRLATRLAALSNYQNGLPASARQGFPRNAWAAGRALLSLITLGELDKDESHRKVFLQGISSAVAIAAEQGSAFRQYLKWRGSDPDAAQLSMEPVASPYTVPLFSANEVNTYWHGAGSLSEFETSPLHRTVWYSAESLAAVMLAGDRAQAVQAAKLGTELMDQVNFESFRDVRPLVALLCGYWRGKSRGLFDGQR